MPPSSPRRAKITESVNTVADSGKSVSKNMSVTCAISGAFSSIIDAVSDIDFPDIDLPDIEFPDFGGDKSLFGDMKEKIEAAVSDISDAMSEAYASINKYMEEFDEFMERFLAKIKDKIQELGAAFEALIIAAFNSVQEFLDKIYDEAAAMAQTAIDAVKDFCSSAADKISSVVSDMGKSISDAFEGMSLSDCKGLDKAKENIDPDLQTDGISKAIANKGKSKSESVVSCLKDGPALGSVDDIHTDKVRLTEGMKLTAPTNDEIKAQIAEKYSDYFGPGKLEIDDFM